MLTQRATLRRPLGGRAGCGLSLALAAISLIAAILSPAPAEARHRGYWHYSYRTVPHRYVRHYWRAPRSARFVRNTPAPAARNFAAIVVDGNSGATLYARNEDEPRHPASITKVMTLYLLFEQLEQGRLSLDSELRISAHAAAQKPTKLGLRPGETIRVDDAIKAVVTRSANDMAVAIAETIGGDEDHFAEMMTRKAHALGMNGTRFVNASGLPDDAQITTARDLSILGRAVQERFPRYYRYFSTHAFTYAGATILNHNHLMDRVEGMDGIKTGYTRASGFNLLTSVKRGGRYIVAVVMGGSSAPARDRIMAGLIEDQIGNAAAVRTASAIVDSSPPDLPQRPRAEARAEKPDLPQRPASAQAEIVAPQTVPAPQAKPLLAYAETEAPAPPRPLQKITLRALPLGAAPAPIRVASIAPDIAVARPPGAGDDTAAIRPGAVKAAAVERGQAAAAQDKALDKMIEKAAVAPPARQPPDRSAAEAARPAAVARGWMIQIGATDDIAKANALLAKAKADGRQTLSAARPFTEPVQKGSETLYRARFAGLEADSAELACRTLKRTGFSCFATKN